jgi:hypothetical protein
MQHVQTHRDPETFWVLGGEYHSMDFSSLVAGTERVVGPVRTRAEAEIIWRELSEATRHNGTMRFSIVSEARAR